MISEFFFGIQCFFGGKPDFGKGGHHIAQVLQFFNEVITLFENDFYLSHPAIKALS